MTTPVAVFETVVAVDATRPRLTWYDDAEGATRGERIELSGRVLANWVAKAANLLVDELGVEPGDEVVLDLPVHWRAAYWALAVWRAGAVLNLNDGDVSDVVITDQPDRARRGAMTRVVAVSLPALGRGWAGDLPAGDVDESADLMIQPDVFEPFEELHPDDVAMVAGDTVTTAAGLGAAASELAARRGWQPSARVAVTAPGGARVGDDGGQLLVAVLAAWSVDGSIVLVRDGDPATLDERWAAERVTSACVRVGRPASRS